MAIAMLRSACYYGSTDSLNSDERDVLMLTSQFQQTRYEAFVSRGRGIDEFSVR
jgi:hypothetical protein